MSQLPVSLGLAYEGLAVFRRALGLLCLVDAAQRLTQTALLYSDLGVLPRFAYYSLLDTTYSWSLYLLSGQPLFAGALLLATALLGAAQLLGRGNRAARIALWVLMFSVQDRQPGIIDAADDLLRLMLFWDIVLPDRPDQASGDLVSLGTLGLQLQLTLALLAVSLFSSPANWLLAAEWGGAALAARIPWLGQAAGVAVVAIWWGRSRAVLLPVVGLVLLTQAVVMHPAYPLTLAAGLSCLWRKPRRLPQPEVKGALDHPGSHKLAMAAWSIVCLASLAWVLLPRPAQIPPLAALGGCLGLHQDWTAGYPLASGLRAELILRAAGYPQPLYNLDLQQGRRLRLLSQALLSDLRLASPLAISFAENAGIRKPVAIWLKTDRLDPDLTLPLQEVRQVSPVTARPGGLVEEESL